MPKVAYFKSVPEVVVNRLAGPRATTRLKDRIDQAICVAEDDGSGVPIWSAVIPDELETDARKETGFLGIGMAEVRTKPEADKILRKRVRLSDDSVVDLAKGDPVPAGGVVVDNDLPPHTFGGYDIETGDIEVVEEEPTRGRLIE